MPGSLHHVRVRIEREGWIENGDKWLTGKTDEFVGVEKELAEVGTKVTNTRGQSVQLAVGEVQMHFPFVPASAYRLRAVLHQWDKTTTSQWD